MMCLCCSFSCGKNEVTSFYIRILKKSYLLCFALLLCKRFPFDLKRPIGYSFAYAVQCFIMYGNFLLSSCLACSGIVAFLVGITITKDLKNILCIIQKNIKIRKNRSHGVKKLYQFIEFHSTTRQLSIDNSNSFPSKPDLTFYFLQIHVQFYGNIPTGNSYSISVEHG